MSFEDSSTVDCCFEEGCARDPQCYPTCREILARIGEAIKAAEAADEPERSDCRCTRESGCCEKTGVCLHGCMAAADDVTRLGEEMEPEAPRRPPYAVAYELQDGSAFEVALPGDATVRADDGLLIIHHAQSPVKGLVQVKPWGDQ